jgi:hypothetical protein
MVNNKIYKKYKLTMLEALICVASLAVTQVAAMGTKDNGNWSKNIGNNINVNTMGTSSSVDNNAMEIDSETDCYLPYYSLLKQESQNTLEIMKKMCGKYASDTYEDEWMRTHKNIWEDAWVRRHKCEEDKIEYGDQMLEKQEEGLEGLEGLWECFLKTKMTYEELYGICKGFLEDEMTDGEADVFLENKTYEELENLRVGFLGKKNTK